VAGKERRVLTRIVRRAPDDTEQYVPEETAVRASRDFDVPHFPSQLAERAIDAFLAMQLGLWQILAALPLYSIKAKKLLEGKHEFREFRFERVFLDWAEMKDDRVPNNSVTILQAGATTYSYPGRETTLIEDSIDLYCPGTVLKKSHSAEVDLQIIVWLNNKDDRGGVRRAVEDAFDEPLDERAGRRVLVPEYWGQTARYTLQEIDYPDDSDSATDNTWPLVAKFRADIDVVKLVKRPTTIKGVLTNVLTTDSDIST